MKRIITIAAATMFAAPAAFAEAHMSEEMTMVQTKFSEAVASCDYEISDEEVMDLTMAQVAGVLLTAGSADESEKCNQIDALLND